MYFTGPRCTEEHPDADMIVIEDGTSGIFEVNIEKIWLYGFTMPNRLIHLDPSSTTLEDLEGSTCN